MNNFGFIILRHVNNIKTNDYWQICYDSIRKFYPENKILIIDDNSNYDFISKKTLHNTIIINSEFHGKGEILPYIYYLQNKLFDSALIIHDSVFIQKKIDFSVTDYKILWDFGHGRDQINDETKMIQALDNQNLKDFYENKSLWKGCFGGMTIITYNFLKLLDNKYNLSKLLDLINSRYNRKSFERVLGCILQANSEKKLLFCDIGSYCPYGIKIKDILKYKHLPMLKVWTGR